MKHMGLKRSFVLLAVLCLLAALLLMAGVCAVCSCIAGGYPRGGISIAPDGTITELERPSAEQERILRLLGGIQIASIAVLPVAGLGLAGVLFYQLKLKGPISVLQLGNELKETAGLLAPALSLFRRRGGCFSFLQIPGADLRNS